jgi:uncharacterized protein YacL
MQGIIILLISFIILFFVSRATDLKPTINYKDKFEYVPIITSNIYADLLIILITFSGILGVGRSWKILEKWYKSYRLSAMLADILIGVIYILITRYLVYYLKLQPDLFMFGVYAVIVQLIFDFLFYLFFNNLPKGANDMLDFFKEWAKYAKLDALWGDSCLVIFAVIVSAYLNTLSFDKNMFLLILSLYLTPYIIYMRH